ncbi:uncharacterized protein LOC143215902 [Lasioglossum baleicum]|uniref:uncharacterized protein LOC143215902 n=1 Tax=Lasioglossum baleicum TaxID=434251 RepID=UPI003FCCC931
MQKAVLPYRTSSDWEDGACSKKVPDERFFSGYWRNRRSVPSKSHTTSFWDVHKESACVQRTVEPDERGSCSMMISSIMRRPRVLLSFHRMTSTGKTPQIQLRQTEVSRFISRCYLTGPRGVRVIDNAVAGRTSLTASFEQVRAVHARMTAPSMDNHEFSRPNNLSEMTSDQLRTFLNSFDVVLSDCDGVLWIINERIPGAVETLKRLQDLGKRIFLVSNNSLLSFDRYKQKVRPGGLELKQEQLIITSKVIAWYLNKIDFRDEVFVIGSKAFRQVLADHGIKMTPESRPVPNEDDVQETVEAVFDIESTKAVVADFSLNAGWAKFAYAVTCLGNKDVLYLTGTMDEWLICGQDKRVIGSGPIIDMMSRQSGRTPIECAKPSSVLKDCVRELCQIKDPKRCLFIGDSTSTDMPFATECGFQKLFVESGLDKIGDAMKNPQTRPDYYLSSLGALLNSIDQLYGKNS